MRSPGTPISEDECASALGPFVAAACGPPCESESEGELDRFQGSTFVRILGRRGADTLSPVMARPRDLMHAPR